MIRRSIVGLRWPPDGRRLTEGVCRVVRRRYGTCLPGSAMFALLAVATARAAAQAAPAPPAQRTKKVNSPAKARELCVDVVAVGDAKLGVEIEFGQALVGLHSIASSCVRMVRVVD